MRGNQPLSGIWVIAYGYWVRIKCIPVFGVCFSYLILR